MNNKYEPVIGLEVHVELNTKTKMFCSCSADYFGKGPNSHTCPVCLGLPGALPFINEQAIESCIKIGLALNCKVINNPSLFERKNYFYPDLPKGYQISQLRWPLCVDGEIEVVNKSGEKRTIRINRAHQEEDTAKLSHQGGKSLIDFNRSGVPLVEIVTEPDFQDSEEVRDYAKKLQQIFRSLGVSNADMERGDMRLEANVSVRRKSEDGSRKTELPPYRVELKNINSFRFMVAAIEFEIKRQAEALENGETLHQETRGWNEDKKETYLQRSKEEANDYRYFPEPDLPELQITEQQIEQIRAELPELSSAKVGRFVQLGLTEVDAKILAGTAKGEIFEEAVKLGAEKELAPKQIANFIINQKAGELSAAQTVEQILDKNSGQLDDDAEIEKLVAEVIAENEQSVAAFKAGKEAALQALIGGVMRKTNGKVNLQKAKEILLKNLLQ